MASPPPLVFLEFVRLSSQVKMLLDHWVACILVMIATCLIGFLYKGLGSQVHHKESEAEFNTPLFHPPLSFSSQPWYRLKPSEATVSPPTRKLTDKKVMRYQRTPRRFKTKKLLVPAAESSQPTGAVQPFEAFLVLDIEGTCKQGSDFNYPNEIIELPVFILQWKDRTENGVASILEVVDEFRTFVKPTWRPILSDFCMELTGITQEQVDSAPRFSEALVSLETFLVKHGLIEVGTGKRQKRFCWCSDGPWDIRDFFVKQCFISQVEMPEWIRGDVLDVRFAVLQWKGTQVPLSKPTPVEHLTSGVFRPSLNIPAQLKVLGLPAFEGRQHSGIDDTRNISKIVAELARRGVRLLPNTAIYPGRRWRWMGKRGQILENVIP